MIQGEAVNCTTPSDPLQKAVIKEFSNLQTVMQWSAVLLQNDVVQWADSQLHPLQPEPSF
jgi:hypothetical protein